MLRLPSPLRAIVPSLCPPPVPGPFCMSPATQAFFVAYHTAPPPVASRALQVTPGDNTPESDVSNSMSPESRSEGALESRESQPLIAIEIEERMGSWNGAREEEEGRGGCDLRHSCHSCHSYEDIPTSCCDIFQDLVGQDMQLSGPFGDLSCTYSLFPERPSPSLRHVIISPRTGAGSAFVPFSPVSGQFSPVSRILPYYSKSQTPNGFDEDPLSYIRDALRAEDRPLRPHMIKYGADM